MSFPPGTEMFQFPGFASPELCIHSVISSTPKPPSSNQLDSDLKVRMGCPIRRSAGQRLLTPHRSLSQRATSFIACACQGIHQIPLPHA